MQITKIVQTKHILLNKYEINMDFSYFHIILDKHIYLFHIK